MQGGAAARAGALDSIVSMSRIVVIGPPGAGTTLVGAALAARRRAHFVDGAELYPTGSRATAAGDAREVWLSALALVCAREAELVVATGLLSRPTRDRIRELVPGVLFAEIVVEPHTAAASPRRGLWGRKPTEVAAPVIDELAADEPGVRVADDADLESVVDRIATVLGARPGQSLR